MKSVDIYHMSEEVFIYPGEHANWHFIPVTKSIGKVIKEKFKNKAAGFGSVRVIATVGTTVWNTSIFPDKFSGSYLLPLKASVRKTEDVMAGEIVSYSIQIV